MQAGTMAHAAAGGKLARYAVGDLPNMRPKLVVKDPILERPTARQMSATDQSVVRSSAAARSRRRVSRYWCGDSPNVRRNSRLKYAGDRCAACARSATVNGSKYRASARSCARSRCRANGVVAMGATLPAFASGQGPSSELQQALGVAVADEL